MNFFFFYDLPTNKRTPVLTCVARQIKRNKNYVCILMYEKKLIETTTVRLTNVCRRK